MTGGIAAPYPSRRRSWELSRLFAALLVAACALGALGWFASGEIDVQKSMGPPASDQARAQFYLFQDMETLLRKELPPGVTVYVVPQDATWNQRLTEFVTGWDVPVARRGSAQFLVDIATPGTATCGLSVCPVVTRP